MTVNTEPESFRISERGAISTIENYSLHNITLYTVVCYGQHFSFSAQIYNYAMTSGTINCTKISMTSLVTVDITLLRCPRLISMRTIHIRVDGILTTALATL